MKGLTKFWLVLGVLLSSIISFGYCDGIVNRQSVNLYNGNSPTSFVCNGYCCIGNIDSASSSRSTSYFVYSGSDIYFTEFGQNDFFCMQYSGEITTYKTNSSTAHVIFYDFGSVFSSSSSSCPDCPTCQENTCIMSVSQHGVLDTFYYTGNGSFVVYLDNDVIYSGYNNPGGSPYIEVSNYCSYTGSESSGDWSALYINDIQHIGAGLINITIPEEIQWDYLYTGNGDQFDLDIKGYNVDTDYIEGIINTQNSKPNKVDFNNTISGLLPVFVPGLVIILLLYFIFRFIKKIF